ncbi:MAG: hypothetical protein H6855_03005 [Rhodospirillales bacterium]|nr:hypothetical protein [Rhodospirillales bacterium]MCB9965035.1 hypothetical protein [Rhodospirillales bacterium]MCB9980363.1 hypothetical protein [Rhodospirillales bacterium]
MPQNAGNTILVVAAVIWSVAGGLGLYTVIQSRSLAELRGQLFEMEAVKPTVPKVTNVAEDAKQVDAFTELAAKSYPDLDMNANGSSVTITANDTRFFPEFREAIGHVQNGGRGWRVNIEELCVGRECPQKPLSIKLKVNRVSIEAAS